MTYQELMDEVIDLGFDSNVESLIALATATNRALAHINRQLRPLEESIVFSQREPLFLCNEETLVADTLMLPTDRAMAVSFESIGEGMICIQTANGTREENLSSTAWRERKILCGARATVSLIGVKDLFVRNIAAFSVAENDNAAYLPIWERGCVRYDLNAMCGGEFLWLASHPYTEAGFAIHEYEIFNGDQLILPDTLRGKVQVNFRRKLRVVTADDFKDAKRLLTSPDIRSEYEDLLALCVASYLWIDVEPEKAQYYQQRFDEQVQYERLKTHQRGRERVIDRKGWR